MKKLLFVLLMVPSLVLGGDPNVYMSVRFDEQSFYPRSGLIFDINPLEPGMTGDLLSSQGDVETGVVGGGCTYCPTGFTCICSDASDVTQETSKVYKNSASAKSVMGATGNSSILWTLDLEANAAYQISLKFKAEVGGTEDFRIQLYQGAQSYDFSTDTWGGAAVASYNNIGSSWATTNLYVNNGPLARAGAVLWISSISINQTIYWDDLQIHKLKSTGPTSAIGPYTMNPAVTSDPVFGNNPNGQMRFADGPAMRTGTSFDGVDDYLSYPDTGDYFDPCTAGKECQLSIGCRVVPNEVPATTTFIFSKWRLSDSNLGWDIRRSTARFGFYISDNGTGSGGHATYIENDGLGTGQLSSAVGVYRGVADGSSLMYLYGNNNAVATSIAADYPIFNSASPLVIGAEGDAAYRFNGSIYHCSLYNKALDAIDASKWINPYFPGNNYNRGSYVTTCSQVASHATCSYDNCRDGTPSGCQAEGTGSMAIFGQGTELIPYNSFETVVGDDSAPTFTGWTIAESAGDGTAKVTAYRDDKKHGNISVRMKTTGTTSYTTIYSTCIPVTPGANYHHEIVGKVLSGVPTVYYRYYGMYTDGACANFDSWGSPLTTTFGAGWTTQGTDSVMGAGINSVVLYYLNYHSAADILIDAVSLKAGTYHTPWVHHPGPAGSVTYNARDYRIHNTLADPIHSTGAYPFSTGFCAGGWIFTDWAGDDGVDHTLLYVPGTAGNANKWYVAKSAGNLFMVSIYDSVATALYKYTATTNVTFPANSWKYFEVCYSGTALNGHYYNPNNSTWYNLATSGGGPSVGFSGQSANLSIGSLSGIEMQNGFTQKIFLVPYNPAYSMTGFNSGRPPMNGQRPY